MSDRAEVAVEDVQSRMMAFVDGPVEETEDETEIEQEASNLSEEVDAGEETTQEESDQESSDDEPIMEIQWGDEKKLVSKSEAKDLAEKGYNYTQNMQALAEQRRSVEAQTQVLQTQVTIHTQLADVVSEVKSLDNQIAQYKQINWGDLAEQDPVQYLKLNQTYRDLKESREALVQEYNQKANHLGQVQEQNRQAILQSESKMLAQKVPEFSGAKAAEAKESLKTYLTNEGFSQAEASNILDHRMIVVAWKAAQYDKLKTAKPEINKRVADAPKILKTSHRTNQKTASQNDLRSKLKQSGRGEYAAKLIEGML